MRWKNRMEIPEINLCAHDQIMFLKIAMTTQWKRKVTLTNAVENWIFMREKNDVGSFPCTIYTIYLKWIKYLNISGVLLSYKT